MTTTAAIGQRSPDRSRAKHGSGMAQAAIQFAQRGWPVLPGSAWNGRRYVVPATEAVTDGLRPLLPRELASIDLHTVALWWRVNTPRVPSVLVRTGRAFDAVRVSRELAVKAVRTVAFQQAPGPVLLRPDTDRAYFLVGPGEAVLAPEGARPAVVEAVPPGSWLAAPPTTTACGAAAWLVPPHAVLWEPVSARVLAEALRVALPKVPSAGWGG